MLCSASEILTYLFFKYLIHSFSACRLVLDKQGLLGGVDKGIPLQLQAPPPSMKKFQQAGSPVTGRKKRVSRFLSSTVSGKDHSQYVAVCCTGGSL